MAFLEFILTAILILIILGYISKFLLKLYLTRLARKMGAFRQEEERSFGETYIKDTTSKDKIVNKDIGDYIDYEEIDKN